MSNLKKFKDLPLAKTEVKLWNGTPEEVTVYVRTIKASEQLAILEKISERYKKKEEAESKQSRDYFYNMMICYYATTDKDGNQLGTFEEFEKYVDSESLERILGAFNKLLLSKQNPMTFLTEDDVELFFKYIKTVDSSKYDGLVAFHIKTIVDFIRGSGFDELLEEVE